MFRLRRFLCGCFGGQALLFLGAIPFCSLALLERGALPDTTRGIIRAVLSAIFLTMPLAQTVFCGMAWWRLKKRKASGRTWAIAASLADLVIGLLGCIAISVYASDEPLRELLDILIFIFIFLSLGIAGLVAFAPRNAVEQMPEAPAMLPRMAGDGTSRVMDGISLLMQIAGILVGIQLWESWTERHGLPHFRFGLIELGAVLLLTVLLHECGHSIVGRALGMRLRAFVVGPFQWHFRDGRWKFQFLPTKLFAAGGAAVLVPADPSRSPRKQICMIAAGPLANLITGLIAVQVALGPHTSPQTREFLALYSTMSLVMFAGNMVPFRFQLYSDGARVYQILSGGPLAEYNHLVSVASSILVTPLRPRDYGINAIQSTASVITNGTQGFILRLLAYSYFLDRGELQQAAAALVETESVFQTVHSEFPPALYTAFVFGNAFVRRDAGAARLWWERLQARKPTDFNVDYWLAKSALHWIEGDIEEADAAWRKSSGLAERLPKLGAYEADRFASSLLREAMDHQPHVAAPDRA